MLAERQNAVLALDNALAHGDEVQLIPIAVGQEPARRGRRLAYADLQIIVDRQRLAGGEEITAGRLIGSSPFACVGGVG